MIDTFFNLKRSKEITLKWLLDDNQRFLIIAVLLFWAGIITLNLDNKLMTAALFAWIGVVSYKFKNIHIGLLLGFVMSLPLVVGKTYSLEVIPVQDLWSKYFPAGYSEAVVIKPINLVTVCMLFLLVRDSLFHRIHTAILKWYSLTLVAAFICMGISALFFSYNPEFSSVIFLQLLQIPIFFLYLTAYYTKDIHRQQLIPLVLAVTICILMGIAGLQAVRSERTGLSVEVSQGEILDDRNFEEVAAGFRPFATFYQANGLAAYTVMTLPLMIVLFLQQRSKLYGAATGASVLMLLLSKGRAAWLAAFVSVLILLYVFEKKYQYNVLSFLMKKKFILYGLLLGLSASIVFILPRALTTIDTLSDSGGGFVRLEQIRESLEVIARFPFFGVGLGMNVSYLFQTMPTGVVTSFPSQIHNGYILQAFETGIPSLLLLLMFLVQGIRNMLAAINQKRLSLNTRLFAVACATGIISLLIDALFQPYLIQHREPYFEVIVLLLFLGLYAIDKPSKTTSHRQSV